VLAISELGGLKQIVTFVADDINLSTMLGNTHGMVLHARTAANIADDENLDVVIFRLRSWLVASWYQADETTEQPCKDDTANTARDN
jgi:hypothetical protein